MIRPVAYVTDLTGFCDMVKKERGIPDDRMMARISMDYGRGSVKVVVSLFDKDQTADGFAAGETKGRRYTGLLISKYAYTTSKLQLHCQKITLQ